jgi:hypothetical protein
MYPEVRCKVLTGRKTDLRIDIRISKRRNVKSCIFHCFTDTLEKHRLLYPIQLQHGTDAFSISVKYHRLFPWEHESGNKNVIVATHIIGAVSISGYCSSVYVISPSLITLKYWHYVVVGIAGNEAMQHRGLAAVLRLRISEVRSQC